MDLLFILYDLLGHLLNFQVKKKKNSNVVNVTFFSKVAAFVKASERQCPTKV